MKSTKNSDVATYSLHANEIKMQKLKHEVYDYVDPTKLPYVQSDPNQLSTDDLLESLFAYITRPVKKDGSCQYSAASVALTAADRHQYMLRRMLAIDFAPHQNFFENCLLAMKCSEDKAYDLK